jgi:hypothetical protein
MFTGGKIATTNVVDYLPSVPTVLLCPQHELTTGFVKGSLDDTTTSQRSRGTCSLVVSSLGTLHPCPEMCLGATV